MFRSLLVPLDGSKLAEAALPPARALAEATRASITLVHIVERDPPQVIHGERHLTDASEAASYLQEVRRQYFGEGAAPEIHVHAGAAADVARSLVAHSQELAPDLIIMCTHGRGGLRGALFGSKAQQVVGQGATPVLLVPPTAEGKEPPSFTLRRILIPLDGSAAHEKALPAALELGQAFDATILLLLVVPTLTTLPAEASGTGILLPGAMSAVLDLACEGGADYLRRQVDRIRAAGIACEAEVVRGDPVATIVEFSESLNADLVVLSTHGKAGMDAFWARSVAPMVAGRLRRPMLLWPVREDQESGPGG
ncbi:MAG: universal stress protein [Anaerolineales bacterium]|jgi:nucleotide-binding universal stress UspA family protein